MFNIVYYDLDKNEIYLDLQFFMVIMLPSRGSSIPGHSGPCMLLKLCLYFALWACRALFLFPMASLPCPCAMESSGDLSDCDCFFGLGWSSWAFHSGCSAAWHLNGLLNFHGLFAIAICIGAGALVTSHHFVFMCPALEPLWFRSCPFFAPGTRSPRFISSATGPLGSRISKQLSNPGIIEIYLTYIFRL